MEILKIKVSIVNQKKQFFDFCIHISHSLSIIMNGTIIHSMVTSGVKLSAPVHRTRTAFYMLAVHICRLIHWPSPTEHNQPIHYTWAHELTMIFSLVTDKPRYRTAYACEGSRLSIECDEGTVIHLIRANYGRFSISICNDHGNLDWSVDCTSARSYYVISQR